MSLYLAIDAGGTKAEYVLADDERILAETRSATIKRMRVSAETALENLRGALEELTLAAGVSLAQVKTTCIGTAGNTVPLVTDWLRQEVGARVGGELLILGDVEIALDAYFPGSHGVLLLAGTGSNVVGRAPNGRMTGAGGHGPVLADQGSGHRIGTQALRALFWALDNERTTALLPAILAHWKLKDADDLVAFANTCEHTEFSTLTPIVLACAQAGDAVAAEVLASEGSDLAQLGIVTQQRLARWQGTPYTPRFAFAGSILEHVQPVREALIAELRAKLGTIEIIEASVRPVVGALWRARHAQSALQATLHT